KLTLKLSHERRSRLVLEVRETNFAAQMFFRTQRFRATELLRDFYDDSAEDAYRMEYRHDRVAIRCVHRRKKGTHYGQFAGLRQEYAAASVTELLNVMGEAAVKLF